MPTHTLLEALGEGDTRSACFRDVSLLAAVIGRGHPSDRSTDDAVDRLNRRFAAHRFGPVAVLSLLYQNYDATAALLIESLDASSSSRPRRSAVTQTLRIATRATRVADTDVPQGAVVTLDLAESGFEFGLGAHHCPGRPLAEAIVTGILTAITTSGYTVVSKAVERDPAGWSADHPANGASTMSAEFLARHRTGTFLLVNVHDAGSAAIAQAAGSVALGTIGRAIGADCLYAPGPRDLTTLRTIVADAGGPVNALIGLGSTLTINDAAAIGVRRVSVGGSLYRATMATFEQLVQQLVRTGSFATDVSPLTDTDLTRTFAATRRNSLKRGSPGQNPKFGRN